MCVCLNHKTLKWYLYTWTLRYTASLYRSVSFIAAFNGSCCFRTFTLPFKSSFIRQTRAIKSLDCPFSNFALVETTWKNINSRLNRVYVSTLLGTEDGWNDLQQPTVLTHKIKDGKSTDLPLSSASQDLEQWTFTLPFRNRGKHKLANVNEGVADDVIWRHAHVSKWYHPFT